MEYSVYVLIKDEQMFYIGCSGNLKERISKHLNGSDKRTKETVSAAKTAGKKIEFKILYESFSQLDALTKEHEFIETFKKQLINIASYMPNESKILEREKRKRYISKQDYSDALAAMRRADRKYIF